MAAMVLRSLHNSRIFDKAFIIEMNEAPGDVKNGYSFNEEILQPKNLTNMSQTTEKPPHQGSIASLESRSFVDQSEEQPLTELHICSYEKCHKFRQKEAGTEATESPSSPLKNALLVLVIVLLIVWIVVYTVLSQLKLL